mmetsp:Transcript_59593/g.143933  ORF Transcript_59593/g.143933 Transcript_59593/m.143933 type:complete len:264 (-) Transcript_59593:2219-3010(-)
MEMIRRPHHLISFGNMQHFLKHLQTMVTNHRHTNITTKQLIHTMNCIRRSTKTPTLSVFPPKSLKMVSQSVSQFWIWLRTGSAKTLKLSEEMAPYSTSKESDSWFVTSLTRAPRKVTKAMTVAHSIQAFFAESPCESALKENHCRQRVTAPSTQRCCAPMKSVGALAMPKESLRFTKCECRPTRTWSRLLAVSSILQLVWNCSRSMSSSLFLLSRSRTRFLRVCQMVSSSRNGMSHMPLVPQELTPPQQLRIIAFRRKNCALL